MPGMDFGASKQPPPPPYGGAPAAMPFSMNRGEPEISIPVAPVAAEAYPVSDLSAPPAYNSAPGSGAQYPVTTTADVVGVLSSLGLSDYAATFEKEGVDGNLLRMLDENALQELGVMSSLHRKKIISWIKNNS